eukprot:GHVH01000867.1.p1 GENE.GHVH01000867.1~~GHVH01000867.1.p1  ORF type:complete len:1699 (+),score=246.05 GHVH01000867.1:26-5098(+)
MDATPISRPLREFLQWKQPCSNLRSCMRRPKCDDQQSARAEALVTMGQAALCCTISAKIESQSIVDDILSVGVHGLGGKRQLREISPLVKQLIHHSQSLLAKARPMTPHELSALETLTAGVLPFMFVLYINCWRRSRRCARGSEHLWRSLCWFLASTTQTLMCDLKMEGYQLQCLSSLLSQGMDEIIEVGLEDPSEMFILASEAIREIGPCLLLAEVDEGHSMIRSCALIAISGSLQSIKNNFTVNGSEEACRVLSKYLSAVGAPADLEKCLAFDSLLDVRPCERGVRFMNVSIAIANGAYNDLINAAPYNMDTFGLTAELIDDVASVIRDAIVKMLTVEVHSVTHLQITLDCLVVLDGTLGIDGEYTTVANWAIRFLIYRSRLLNCQGNSDAMNFQTMIDVVTGSPFWRAQGRGADETTSFAFLSLLEVLFRELPSVADAFLWGDGTTTNRYSDLLSILMVSRDAFHKGLVNSRCCALTRSVFERIFSSPVNRDVTSASVAIPTPGQAVERFLTAMKEIGSQSLTKTGCLMLDELITVSPAPYKVQVVDRIMTQFPSIFTSIFTSLFSLRSPLSMKRLSYQLASIIGSSPELKVHQDEVGRLIRSGLAQSHPNPRQGAELQPGEIFTPFFVAQETVDLGLLFEFGIECLLLVNRQLDEKTLLIEMISSTESIWENRPDLFTMILLEKLKTVNDVNMEFYSNSSSEFDLHFRNCDQSILTVSAQFLMNAVVHPNEPLRLSVYSLVFDHSVGARPVSGAEAWIVRNMIASLDFSSMKERSIVFATLTKLVHRARLSGRPFFSLVDKRYSEEEAEAIIKVWLEAPDEPSSFNSLLTVPFDNKAAVDQVDQLAAIFRSQMQFFGSLLTAVRPVMRSLLDTDDDDDILESACEVYQKIVGVCSQTWIPINNSAKPFRRIEAIVEYLKLEDAEFVQQVLVKLLSSPWMSVKGIAVDILSKIESEVSLGRDCDLFNEICNNSPNQYMQSMTKIFFITTRFPVQWRGTLNSMITSYGGPPLCDLEQLDRVEALSKLFSGFTGCISARSRRLLELRHSPQELFDYLGGAGSSHGLLGTGCRVLVALTKSITQSGICSNKPIVYEVLKTSTELLDRLYDICNTMIDCLYYTSDSVLMSSRNDADEVQLDCRGHVTGANEDASSLHWVVLTESAVLIGQILLSLSVFENGRLPTRESDLDLGLNSHGIGSGGMGKGAFALSELATTTQQEGLPLALGNTFWANTHITLARYVLSTRHPAVMDKFKMSLESCSSIMLDCDMKEVVIENLDSVLCLLVEPDSPARQLLPKPPALRKSLPYCLCVHSMIVRDVDGDLLRYTAEKLMACVDSSDAQSQDLGSRIHALNLFRHLVRSSELSSCVGPLLPSFLRVGLDNLRFNNWSVRNSASFLFESAFRRTGGTENERKRADVDTERHQLAEWAFQREAQVSVAAQPVLWQSLQQEYLLAEAVYSCLLGAVRPKSPDETYPDYCSSMNAVLCSMLLCARLPLKSAPPKKAIEEWLKLRIENHPRPSKKEFDEKEFVDMITCSHIRALASPVQAVRTTATWMLANLVQLDETKVLPFIECLRHLEGRAWNFVDGIIHLFNEILSRPKLRLRLASYHEELRNVLLNTYLCESMRNVLPDDIKLTITLILSKLNYNSTLGDYSLSDSKVAQSSILLPTHFDLSRGVGHKWRALVATDF